MANSEENTLAGMRKEIRFQFIRAVIGGVLSVVVAALIAAWALLQQIPYWVGVVPTGAVASFELTTCPFGWDPYNKAWGRFIIGAAKMEDMGQIPGDFRQDKRGVNLIERPFMVPGGEQAHKLTLEEMPEHSHGGATGGASAGALVKFPAAGNVAGRFAGDVPFSIVDHTHAITPEGRNEPHNNMPPYIALTYCKKR